jgi:hypothetical protein
MISYQQVIESLPCPRPQIIEKLSIQGMALSVHSYRYEVYSDVQFRSADRIETLKGMADLRSQIGCCGTGTEDEDDEISYCDAATQNLGDKLIDYSKVAGVGAVTESAE